MTIFHAAFDAIMNGDTSAVPAILGPVSRSEAALAVYRNTAVKARIDALQANYPTVADLVGADWFRAAGAEYVTQHPTRSPVLADYGQAFADWLARFPPARVHPYLPLVARLDRAWTEAHLAPDATPLSVDKAARLGLALAGMTAVLHPSARLFQFDWSAPSIWLSHRYPETGAALEWQVRSEALLILRPHLEVKALMLSPVEMAFLNACRRGRPLGAAGMAARQVDPRTDVSTVLATLIRIGAFADISSGASA